MEKKFITERKHYIYLAIIVIIVATASFFGGVLYGKKSKFEMKSVGFGDPRAARIINGGGDMRAFDGNGGKQRVQTGKMINGEVLSNDGSIITLKLRDGGSKIIFISGSTKLDKSVSAVVSDAIVGNSIIVTGQTNPDGSLTAESIQIR